MNLGFERRGSLKQLSSYPQWAQDVVGECEGTKQSVVEHELWEAMCSARLGTLGTANFMMGIWPVIERFPGYMAMSLLKTRYGRSAGDNLARRWLVRNIRVEQNHAEHWLNWAEGAGVPREKVLRGLVPIGTQVLASWCEEISRDGSLAAGVAAVNYAVEGATGEWSRILNDSDDYAEQFPEPNRRASLRWLQLHAAYDDVHPWEALEIVCTLLGNTPNSVEVAHISECVRRSYTCMRMLADCCLRATEEADLVPAYRAAVA